jgi:glyoxylase I family protein
MTQSAKTPGREKRTRRGSMNHLRLTVTNIDKAREFYEPFLVFMGYELMQRSDVRLAWTAPGPAGGHQHVIVTMAGEAHALNQADGLRPGLHHFAFAADSRAEVDKLHAIMSAAGAEIEGPPAEYHYQPGYYAIYFRDPDDTKLEFVFVP